ncbi:2-dehydropantoate 2-reductase [Bacillus sp. NPDC077027]|uniref:2-dehydropantoate 2-reductase n=1 Tax=Bacillus sp. NPDC077027 TaxID=3390548 RepID=UPI003D0011D1
MKIGIVGGGSVGLLCACYLSKQHEVTVLTKRKEQAEKIKANGIELTANGKVSRYRVQAMAAIKGRYDLLIVTVKYYQLKEVMSELTQLARQQVLFLQNGMAHVLDLLHWKSPHQLFVGVVEHGGLRTKDDAVEHTGFGTIKWGSLRERAKTDLPLWLHDMSEDFQMTYSPNWRQLLEEKLIVNVCINPLTAILHIKNGELISNQSYYHMMRTVFEEAAIVLEVAQKEVMWDHIVSICTKTADNKSSMLQDIQANRQTERFAILGYLLIQAKELGIDTPHLSFLNRNLEVLENKQTKSFE